MSCSLYYTAKRSTSLTDTENQFIKDIIEKYNSEYPFSKKTEGLCVYKFSPEDDIIFNGSVEIPSENGKISFYIAGYWLMCLNEITNILSDCKWKVMFDDNTEMIWNPDIMGWRYPTDTEYSRQNRIRANTPAMEMLIYKYCTEENIIDGVKTYIIPKERYDEFYHDIKISEFFNIMKEHSLSFIKYIKEINIPEICLSIVCQHGGNVYYLVPCYKYDGKLYHVSLKNGWFCPECRQPNTFDGIYAIPMYEDDLTFLPLDVTPEIPPVFKKIPCQKCGKPLNRQFMKVN